MIWINRFKHWIKNTSGKPVRVLMSAINGYGHYYLKTLLEEVSEDKAVLVGVIDPEAEKSEYINLIRERNIPVFDTIEEYFRHSHKADLTVISSPPQYHVEQALIALNNKSNVLIDKPVGIGEEAVKKLIKKARRKRKWIEVGYQWSFSSPIQELKKDILKGVYGVPFDFKAICLWPRDYDYYSRNNWAGRKKDDDGRLVLDSPPSNACAHFLHNLLFLCGKDMESSGSIAEMSAYKYRAYQIENFDTVSMDIMTQESVQILFYASHATEYERAPEFYLEFTKGFVKYDADKGIVAYDKSGKAKFYGKPDEDHQFKKLFHSIDKTLKGGANVCPPKSAISHTVCVDILNSDMHQISDCKKDLIIDDGNRRWVLGLNEIFNEAYDKGMMLANFEL